MTKFSDSRRPIGSYETGIKLLFGERKERKVIGSSPLTYQAFTGCEAKGRPFRTVTVMIARWDEVYDE